MCELLGELRARVGRLAEAFLYERSIGRDVYERQRDKVQEELAIAELEFYDSRIDEAEIDGVLTFAE